MEAVDIFFRSNRKQNARGIDLRRQRKLHQDAVNFVPVIELVDEIQQFFGCRGGAGSQRFAVDAEFGRSLGLAPDINLRRRIFARENDSEAGRAAETCRR